jgi:hypothetical protein
VNISVGRIGWSVSIKHSSSLSALHSSCIRKRYVDDLIENTTINQKTPTVIDQEHHKVGHVIIDIQQRASEIVSETIALDTVNVIHLM